LSILEAIEFQRHKEQLASLAAQVVELGALAEALVARLAALEAATATECAAIASRRKADSERQRRKRHRHVIEAAEMLPPDQVLATRRIRAAAAAE
jgi:hypothetical protein